jgi:hypothetical protein
MKLYRKRGLTRMIPWNMETDMAGVSVSPEDSLAGSPRIGDMIAEDPSNNARWLVSKKYFDMNYEEVK